MAGLHVRRSVQSFGCGRDKCALSKPRASVTLRHRTRFLQTKSYSPTQPPNCAFAFDIDGVLLRSAKPLPGAQKALRYLHHHRVPFILLTNGGGTREENRVAQLSKRLEVPLDTANFIQSHTPFTQLVSGYGSTPSLKDKCILVVGGDGDNCRQVAEKYGFTNVITPADLITTFPALWPFAAHDSYSSYGRSLTQKTLSARDGTQDSNAIKVDAILVFNDPRDWALDTQIILDLLMSRDGYLGSISAKNGVSTLPNQGWQQDGQPSLYFSNPDIFWAAEHHLPRMGQGAFRESFRGVWNAITGGPTNGVGLKMQMFGKPYQGTYEFAEKMLRTYRKKLLEKNNMDESQPILKKVYMIGDNPESDILGANQYRSANGSSWKSILVRSGVYNGGVPAHRPEVIVDGVWDAILWGLKDSGWEARDMIE